LRFSKYIAQLQEILSPAVTSSDIMSTSSSGSSSSNVLRSQSVLLAVSPNCGWVPGEVRAFQRRGVQLVNLGPHPSSGATSSWLTWAPTLPAARLPAGHPAHRFKVSTRQVY
jgi:hypothetical protein